MSSRNSDNNPSSSHQAAPAGDDHDHQSSSGEQSGNPTATARLNYYRSNTNRLLDFLRQSNRDSLDRFISVVRSGASHDDIFATIDQLSPSAGEQRSKQNGVPS